MNVIPVIDLKAGEVVHARRGDRDNYRPIVSQLCNGSRPVDVVGGLLDVYPFNTIYIADLDAIQRRGDSDEPIAELQREFPRVEFWIDRGLGDVASCRDWLSRSAGTLVLGSEAVGDAAILQLLHGDVPSERLVLSLDFRGEQFQGPSNLLAQADEWPARVIVMTLSRVGSGAGPDFVRLDEIKRRGGPRQIFAAGGVRDGDDLLQLARQGVGGVLIASALHDRKVGRAEVAAAVNGPA